MTVKRFGVSLEENIMEVLDEFVREHHFPNRSQAIRHLIKNINIQEKWEENEEVLGAVVLVYDITDESIQNQSRQVQHGYHCLILSVQYVHIGEKMCLETITLKGKARKLKKLSDKLIAIKGIQDGKLIMSG